MAKNNKKPIKKKKSGAGRFILSACVAAVVIAANVVLTTVIPGLMDTMFGGDRTERILGTGDTQYYKADEGITDKASAKAAGDKLNEQLCEEGFTLLQNDGTLPLDTSKGKLKVSVFGQNSVDIAYGSSGSVGGELEDPPTVKSVLEASGFEVNSTLWNMYKNSGNKRPTKSLALKDGGGSVGFPTAELAVDKYTDGARSSFASYGDAAFVVITRTSGEQNDMPTTMKNENGGVLDGAASADDHYLELDQNEQDMLQLACENFDKVVLLLNSSVPLELGFLEGNNYGDTTLNDYDYASHINAVLWMGMPGESGLNALGKILNGTVNPSGRTVDTYVYDFMSIPAVENFACDGTSDSDYYYVNGVKDNSAYFIDYEEGIYVGYKYFETRGATDGEEWYDKNVQYPFGYGLSYTEFEWRVEKKASLDGSKLDKSDTVEIEVTVTNKGDVAGKDVVELYVTPPYTSGGIEKSSKVLVDFVKTKILQPGESETVTLSFNAYDVASYDDLDANKNGIYGYELEAGDYAVCVSKNSHEAVESVTLNVEEDIYYEYDETTEVKVENRFSDADDQLQSVLSRNDWEGTYPSLRTDKNVSSEFIAKLNSKESHSPINENDPTVIEYAEKRPAAKGAKDGEIKIYDFIGLDDADCDWDGLIKQLSFKQMYELISMGAFNTKAIPEIGKLDTAETDGPSGFVNFMDETDRYGGCCFYCSECVVGATWNKELAHELGNAIGNEGLFGWKSESGDQRTYSGWYAPGVNIHRTPFGGRNPEYYSEDGIFNGIMASEVIKGAKEKGVYCYLKHFAANEQETHRNGVCTWLTEQSYREIYLRPFELAVKEGGTTAIMSSFNRVGTTWTGGDYRLLTEVLRGEWGFKGTVISDFAYGQPQMDFTQMLYAGGDLWLDTVAPANNLSKSNIADVYVLQEAMENILYTQLNSNAMNGLGTGATIIVKMAYWRIVMIVADVVIGLVLVAWMVFGGKKKKQR